MPFCSTCQLELPETQQVCPVDRTLLTQRCCDQCQNGLGRLDKFCGLCGADASEVLQPVRLPTATKLRILASLIADLHIFSIGYGVCLPAFLAAPTAHNHWLAAAGFTILAILYWVGLTSGGRQTAGQYLASCIAVKRDHRPGQPIHPQWYPVMAGAVYRVTLRKLGFLQKYDWAFEVLHD